MAPNTGNTTTPSNVTIGLTPYSLATLNVRGDDLPVSDDFSPACPDDACYLATFRTDVPNGYNQNWSMVQGEHEIGRLWHTADNESFNIGSRQLDHAPMWVRNGATDGLRLAYNHDFTMNDFPLHVVGYAQLGEHTAIDGLNPLSRLTLVNENQGADDPSLEYRPWMRNGLSGTGNSDMFYLGQQNKSWGEEEVEESDSDNNMVAAWGEQALPEGAGHEFDSFQFRYIDGSDGGSAGDIDGLELLRLRPFREHDEDPVIGYVGIGDWNSTSDLPGESLDIKEGTIRIRKLPADYHNTGEDLDKMVVSDDDGRLFWRSVSAITGGGGGNCDWVVENTGTSGSSVAHDVYTAVGSSDACPDVKDAVGIGMNQPDYKLDVKHKDSDTQRPGGLRVEVETNNAGWRNGIASIVYPKDGGTELSFGTGITANITNVGHAENTTADGYGVFSRSTTDEDLYVRKSVGVYGDAVASDGTPTSLWGGEFSARGTGAAAYEGMGVYAHVSNASGTMTNGYGIYAEATGGATNNYAGWFQGAVNISGAASCTAMAWTSDASLKTNVEDITDASAVLGQVHPRSYEFLSQEHPDFNLPTGPQLGVIAQELEVVLPQLVTSVNIGGVRDEEGQVVEEASTVKAVNYIGLIPLLVAGFQEQSARIAALESDLASCCSNEERALHGAVTGALEADLRIIPNPIADRTELRYTVAEDGRVRLQVTDASGRTVRTQDEGARSAGVYVYEWDTTTLGAGTYYCTLFVNDEPLVKKAVKLQAR